MRSSNLLGITFAIGIMRHDYCFVSGSPDLLIWVIASLAIDSLCLAGECGALSRQAVIHRASRQHNGISARDAKSYPPDHQ